MHRDFLITGIVLAIFVAFAVLFLMPVLQALKQKEDASCTEKGGFIIEAPGAYSNLCVRIPRHD